MRIVILVLLILVSMSASFAQTSAFTYQGKLNDAGIPANGQYDLVFRLYELDEGGSPIAAEQVVENVQVTAGLFKVALSFDFTPFTTIAAQWIEVAVRPGSSTGGFTTLSPRQQITSSPYSMQSAFSVFSTIATTANNALAVGGTPAAQIIKEGDTRLNDARTPLAGSPSYVQNTTSTQTSSNFNVSGVGRAGTFRSPLFDAIGEYQIFGGRVLAASGDNLSVGGSTGGPSTGSFNTYLGFGAGSSSTSNASQNTFAGTNSGSLTTSGTRNSFFGARSGLSNDNGGANTFVGEGSGVLTTTGSENSFFGADSGQSNSTGSRNSYFGVWSGGLPGITDSSAIGYRAFATQSNTLILGSVNGFNGAASSPRVGIGTTAPTQQLHVVGDGLFTGNLSTTGAFSGNGSSITSLNAANIETGTLAPARLNNAAILNQTTLQASSNFNVSGTGTVGGAMSALQFNLGGNRVLSSFGTNNIFVGVGTGILTTGSSNSFVGAGAGSLNTTGASNTFVGSGAGGVNTQAVSNSFFGANAGSSTTQGSSNVFIGAQSGAANSTGLENTFVGTSAGLAISTGSRNVALGYGTTISHSSLTNATAIGHRALVSSSDSIVLGSVNGVNGATADTRVGIGTTSPVFKLDVIAPSEFGLRVQTGLSGILASFGGLGTFGVDAPGVVDGRFSIREDGNVGIGIPSPLHKLHVRGENLRLEGTNTTVIPRFSLHYTGATANGGKWQNYASGNGMADLLTFGALNDAENSEQIWMRVVRFGGSVSNVQFPTGNLIVSENLSVSGNISVSTLGAAGGTQLCRNAGNQISTCSSSLRYKTNIFGFTSGMDFINRLRPISFDWKDGGMKDVGFGAEDIAKIDPRFVTFNDKGEVEGVKYDRFSVAFVNAFKEQQSEIERLQKEIDAQKTANEKLQLQLDALKKLVCDAGLCK